MSGSPTIDAAYLLRRAGRSYASATAVDDGARSVTFAELIDRAERLVTGLHMLGLQEGQSVGILADNCTAFVEADVALALGEFVRVPLNARQAIDDFRYVARDSNMRALFFGERFAEDAHRLAEETGLVPVALDGAGEHTLEALVAAHDRFTVPSGGSAEQTAWITYTSGTTGRPKGVVLSRRAIREVALNLLLELGPVSPGTATVLCQPLSHGAGYFVLPYLMAGGSVFVQRRFDPEEVVALSRLRRPADLKIVPAMLPPILELDTDGWDFRSTVYGASPIPAPLLERSLDRLGPTLVQIYGQTEAPITLTCLGKDDHTVSDGRTASAGRPWKSVAVEIVGDDGEIVSDGSAGEIRVRGSHLMTEYHNLPEQTADVMSDGWVRTRDMGRRDENGFIHLLGRSDEMINSGGFNISPREVEAVLARHEKVREVAVVGVPDERWGDAVTAVVRATDSSTLTEAEVIEFARPLLGYRCPRTVHVRDSIPLTPYGKVDRTRILASLAPTARAGSASVD